MKELTKGLILFIGLGWLFLYADRVEWQWFLGIILFAVFVPEIIFSPVKKASKNKQKRKKPQAKKTTKHSAREKLSENDLLKVPIESLSGSDFEKLVAMYYSDHGYNPRIIGGSGDHEVDLILIDPKEGYKIAVQCKRWTSKNVGNDTILRLSAGKRVHKCLDAWCITTTNYTKSAKEAAEELNIRLLNGLHVKDQIDGWRKRKLVAERKIKLEAR